jgi:hypothetical protein
MVFIQRHIVFLSIITTNNLSPSPISPPFSLLPAEYATEFPRGTAIF